jgi:arginine decarboxylase
LRTTSSTTISQVCDDENVPHPTIIQESGRFLSAYHAILVTNVLDEIETVVEDITPIEIDEDDPQVVSSWVICARRSRSKTIASTITTPSSIAKNSFTLFNLGLISLEDRAKGEVLFWDVCERADRYAQQSKYVPEEFGDLRKLLCAKYLANFSVFKSVPRSLGPGSAIPDRADSNAEQAAY